MIHYLLNIEESAVMGVRVSHVGFSTVYHDHYAQLR